MKDLGAGEKDWCFLEASEKPVMQGCTQRPGMSDRYCKQRIFLREDSVHVEGDTHSTTLVHEAFMNVAVLFGLSVFAFCHYEI